MRALKVESALRLDEAIAEKVAALDIGSEVGTFSIREDPRLRELGAFSDTEILSCLHRRMSEGHLLPLSGDATRFHKVR